MSHFNDVANDWDSPEKIKLMHTLAANTKNKINLDENLDVMDFGCGTGLFGLEFSQYAKSMLGVDTSEGMLKVFDEKTKNHPGFKSVLINLEEHDLDQKFDLIVTSMAFHHLNQPKKVLAKFKEMLNQKGKILVVDLDEEDGTFHPDNEGMGVKHFGFGKEELTQWASELGLNIDHYIINELEKNDRSYKQFLAVYTK